MKLFSRQKGRQQVLNQEQHTDEPKKEGFIPFITGNKKKIYLVHSNIMNGTVTMDVLIVGIEADTYEEAISIFRKNKSDKIRIINKEPLRFVVDQDEETMFKVTGYLDIKPLEMLKTKE